MTDEQVVVIKTKHVTDLRVDTDHLLVIGTEDDRSKLREMVAAGVSALNSRGVDDAYECAEREYDPAEYDHGTVVARIQPDGTTEWPLEDDQ
jgi:hypothetical protein